MSILTVLTPAPDRMLATAADVRAELAAPSATDAALNPLILQASDLISGACNGRVFGREGLREVFRSISRADCIVLARDPVTAVTSIVLDGTTLTEGADFEVDGPAGILYRLSGDARATWSATKLTIEYTAGWLLPSQVGPTLPTDVRRVCVERAARMWNGQGRDSAIRSDGAQEVGQVSYFDPEKLSVEEDAALARYRIYRL